ncbi:hypothetical protein BRADI_3g31471v3 [Brachypodium distachyon]|uniref:Uncharacterized protein n=1 Tax=Brachypodium distachyon TaxID=15368 RepID=A0A2K2D0D8_BRADI|nr:hypothetical protein BRADI_3g31471v3 [Brachypodium distachyon]
MQNSSPNAGKSQKIILVLLKFLFSLVFTHCNWGCLILGDISLQVIGKKSATGATYKSMELVKLLDVCDEEQRLRIIAVLTEDPVKLVKISL